MRYGKLASTNNECSLPEEDDPDGEGSIECLAEALGYEDDDMNDLNDFNARCAASKYLEAPAPEITKRLKAIIAQP